MNARLSHLDSCADEPFRVPGAIQPHGRMLVLDASTGRELAYSANWRDEAQRHAALGALEDRWLELADGESPAPLGVVTVAGERLDASGHRLGGQVVVEFEPPAADRGAQAPIYSLARHFLPQLQRARSVDDLLGIGVRELKRLTGFGRCLACRFDHEGRGEVLAEALDEGYESHAGHRFPASDIPAQVRALYCLNVIRLIPDAHCAPVPLISTDPAPAAIDLSLAGLRSDSPVHLEYLRNMGTRASMSVSIVVRGQLWGLVSCHDRDTRFLSFPARAACEHLGRLLSLQVEAAEERAEAAQRLELRQRATTPLESAAALLKAKEEAERANRAKDRFLAVLSHELRTPLLPIAAAAQTLQKNVAVPPELSELLPMIRRNVLLEARLIEDLLDLTAISEGKLSLRRAPVDMRKIIDAVVEMVQETVDEKQIDLAVHWNARRGIVDGDAARLQQVLWNLVRNAVKFTPAGGHIRIAVDDDADDARLRLRCIDDGIGIEPGALGTIFSAFEQAGDDVARQFGGLGLGLAIAQALVLGHGGELSASSEGPGCGATFTLRLDTIEAPDVAADRPPAPAPHSGASRPLRMLLVEDNEDAACALSMSLEFMGYEVTHAANLRAAMAAGQGGAFDVIVTDLGLPDGSGLALGPALSARVPLIALSGFGSAEDVARSMAAGFAAHLVKPTDPDDVHATVGKILMRAMALP